MWLYKVTSPKDEDGIANNVDPEQSDLGLHCLPRAICPKTWDHYDQLYVLILKCPPILRMCRFS